MEKSQVQAREEARRRWPLPASIILFLLAYLVARAVLEMPELAVWVRVLVALLPVAPFIGVLYGLSHSVGQLDELEERIQLEALALAFPLAMILLLTLGLLEIAIPLPPEDLSYRHVWAMLPVLYFIGLIVATRRYQ